MANLLHALLQGDDRRHCIEALHAMSEARDFLLDQHLSVLRFSPAIAYVGFHDLLEIIDVVNEDSVYVAHFWSHVSRYSDVDEEHRPILAPVHEQLAMLAPEDGVWRAGGSDHDVGLIGSFVWPVKVSG